MAAATRKRSWALSVVILSIAISSTTLSAWKDGSDNPPKTHASDTAAKIKINLDQATEVKLPQTRHFLTPATFRTTKGEEGWIVRVPGGRPIATPAYADGMLFVGGGYGSHEFYAFNANTGDVVWKIDTGDDGPTAAVVEGGYVGFNTESCTVLVVDEKTGKIVWKEWLGDPLMSQPAISDGKLYIVYPGGQRNHKQAQISPDTQGFSHRLLAADLKTGKHLWEQPIPSDVISAPVISGGEVYVTCFEGTSLAFNARTGGVLWTKKGVATSAPLAVGNQVVLTRKVQQAAKMYEGMVRIDAQKGEEKDKELLAKTDADYLREDRGSAAAMSFQVQKSLDSSVGFASAPAAAKIAQANKSVGVSSVVGGWAFQGSRAAHNGDSLFNAQGKYLNSVNAKDGKSQWQAELTGAHVNNAAQIFAPPALGREYMYLAGSNGLLVSVRQKDGGMGFAYALGKPIAFQPALAKGNIYLGTADGSLICLKSGSVDADGWYSWGGNAQHNK
ncbi:MAG TPA: PQQ-binding-like beta-propeller repeat protein [Terriglobales bacterium]|nr:PQQ-binding-like beta-propeller repeat protein [Terriglobales bacterium]